LAALGREIYREFQRPDDATPMAIEGLLLQLAAQTTRWARSGADRREPPWLRHVTDAMRAGLKAPLKIGDLALEARVHPVYLARAFRKHYGCSPAEFIRRLRVEAARVALARTEMPLTAVALESGFADQSHLTRQFRRIVGTSPGRYRKEHRMSPPREAPK
jgi:AraC family transcriptional regulator